MPSRNTDKSPIESLREKLYQRERAEPSSAPEQSTPPPPMPPRTDTPTDWAHQHEPRMPKKASAQHPVLKWFLILSTGFFIVAVAIAFFVLSGERNIISSRNVDIAIAGPIAIPAGEELELRVGVQNNNTTTLQIADLIVEYPEGTRSAVNVTRDLPRHRESLGNIRPGEQVTRDVSAILFGEQGQRREIMITIEYRVAGSNAIFFTEKTYEIEISSSPLSLSVAGPEETGAGEEVVFTLTLDSNAEAPLNDVAVRAEFPFGFEPRSAQPSASFGTDNVWDIGTLAPGTTRTIQIAGTLEGQESEERVFRFEAGIQSVADERVIETPFTTTAHEVAVSRPSVALDVVIDGARGSQFVAIPGRTVRVDVAWRNNLSGKIADATLEAVLVGSSLDSSSVSASRGFFDSSARRVVWDSRSDERLAVIDAGSSGTASFSFATDPSGDVNPELTLQFRLTARSLSDSGPRGAIVSTTEKRVQVASAVVLSGRTVHFVGPFSNSGPIPPQAETQTTYTVIWSLTNSSNDIAQSRVSAVLPSYIEWLGAVHPSGESVSFNPVGGEVVWDAGDVRAQSGFSRPPREVAFQIALSPSISQIGAAPVLIGETTFSGRDTFTNTTLSESVFPLSTRLSTDPQFGTGDERVVE